jgi:NAD(P)H-hydrate epimerase
VRSVGAGGLAAAYDLCLDGIFGFQYRPPLPAEARAVIMASAQARIRLRAAVDLPTGWSEAGAFKADFTYATGTVKEPIVGCPSAGRPRFLDLGFYPEEGDGGPNRGERVVLPSVLCPVAGLRRADADKRSQGRLVILGGSEGLPGAVLMTALAALKSGVGLLTVFVPESLAAAYAARAPEAMWAGLPVTAGGGLDPRGLPKVVAALAKADALAMGPGLGKDPKAREFARQVARISRVPMVIDAEALQPQIVRAGRAPRILTPHAGEFERIAGGATQRSLCSTLKACIVLKGPVTRISDGGAVYHSFFGGPVLARGGSGDILAGLAGGLLAQSPGEPLAAACRAAVWHAMAADHLARSQGQAAVRTLQLLDFLSAALRESHQGD